jgi:hypothetical protein
MPKLYGPATAEDDAYYGSSRRSRHLAQRADRKCRCRMKPPSKEEAAALALVPLTLTADENKLLQRYRATALTGAPTSSTTPTWSPRCSPSSSLRRRPVASSWWVTMEVRNRHRHHWTRPPASAVRRVQRPRAGGTLLGVTHAAARQAVEQHWEQATSSEPATWSLPWPSAARRC